MPTIKGNLRRAHGLTMKDSPETPSPVLDRATAKDGESLAGRFGAFVAEAFPFAVGLCRRAFELALAVERGRQQGGQQGEAPIPARLRSPLRQALTQLLAESPVVGLPETTPGMPAARRRDQAALGLIEACDGFLAREAILASLDPEEKREILRGMILTRATDNRLKTFFASGEVRHGRKAFQGKGFRSLGQEAIYAAALRLRRGQEHGGDSGWRGDVVAPLIRGLGVALAMDPSEESVRQVLSAQMAKAGPPMSGKDLHIGNFSRGVLPPAAPLAISSLNVAGLAFAMAREGEGRVALAFIGEGGTSLGEWHEAINLCAVRRLPAIFCVENNQTALATPVGEQSVARVFADKALGYGIPGLTLDGTDPEAIAAAFTWAAERARQGEGPALLELVSLRMCGHAHHDDMLYLGKEPPVSRDYPELAEGGYADPDAFAFWRQRDPIARYAERLGDADLLAPGELDSLWEEAEAMVERAAQLVVAAPWPDPAEAGEGTYSDQPPERHVEILADRQERSTALPLGLPEFDPGLPPAPTGRTFLEAVMLGVGDALAGDERVFLYGEDIGGAYGNAFLLLRPLLEKYGERIINSTLAESGVLGVCVGAALAGQRPIGEIQFNDFVATGFNQLVNNAAKIHYRWGASVPMVVRMPWGGLRHAGPYHSQNTEAWFYRTPGLKIVAPSTPEDARALFAAAVADPDPVLYYEHIALYRDPRIKQDLPEEAPEPLPLGKAALRRQGDDLGIISYGAYVHASLRVAQRLAADGIEAAVLDLRSLVPLDRQALLRVARHCNRVLIVHEDTRRGGIGESLAAIVQEEAFEYLEAPVRILAALDTPVPYSPPLEAAFLPGEERIEKAARLLASY